MSTGVLHLRLRIIDEITSATIRLRNTGKEIGNIENGRMSKAMKTTSETSDIVANQLSENGDLYQDIGKLLLRLDIFAKVAGDFAAVRFHSSSQSLSCLNVLIL